MTMGREGLGVDAAARAPSAHAVAIESMRVRPLDFVCGEFTLCDQATGIHYWVANGWGFYGVYVPQKYNFSFLGQFAFGRALKEWRARWLEHQHLNALAGAPQGK